MLVMRLARTGRKKYPTYRVVVADSRRASTGKFVSLLGHYNPHTKELVLDKDEVKRQLKNGAQPSNRMIKLLQQEKIELPAWAELKTRPARKPKKEPQAKPEPPAAAPAAEEAGAEDEVRVGEQAQANAAEISEPAQEATNLTETAADGETQADAATEGRKAAAEAAVEAAGDGESA